MAIIAKNNLIHRFSKQSLALNMLDFLLLNELVPQRGAYFDDLCINDGVNQSNTCKL